MKYSYRGNAKFIDNVGERLEKAGFAREGEVELADVVLTFCNSISELEDLYFGDDGIVQLVEPGTTLIDCSAATPNFAKEMNAICTLSDLVFVEAPLVVRDMVAKEPFARSNLTCFIAGESDVSKLAMQVIDALFGDVQPVGGPGAAQLARAAQTLQQVAEMLAAIEATALFRAAKHSLSSVHTEGMKPEPTSPEAYMVLKAIDEERFDGQFTCEMLYGELVAAIMAADDYELIMPQAEAASHLLELISLVGGSDMSPAAISLIYGDESESAKYGLDWSRAEAVYGVEGEDDLMDGFEIEYDDDDFDDYDDDSGEVGFGYSIN